MQETTSRTYMGIGCGGDVISMTCSTDGTSNITIAKATYGSYDMTCSDSCCAPNPVYDCVEDMQTVNPDFFEYLQFVCNGEQSCNVEFNSYVMDTYCAGVYANYLQVFFECSHVIEGSISFMARNVEREHLISTEVVPWRDVITNFGSHYYPATYSFICPVSGIYVFSVTTRTYNDHIWVCLLRNDHELLRVYVDGENGDYDMSSSSSVTECRAGDAVWVIVGSGGSFVAHTWNYHVFSGFLLNKL